MLWFANIILKKLFKILESRGEEGKGARQRRPGEDRKEQVFRKLIGKGKIRKGVKVFWVFNHGIFMCLD